MSRLSWADARQVINLLCYGVGSCELRERVDVHPPQYSLHSTEPPSELGDHVQCAKYTTSEGGAVRSCVYAMAGVMEAMQDPIGVAFLTMVTVLVVSRLHDESFFSRYEEAEIGAKEEQPNSPSCCV